MTIRGRGFYLQEGIWQPVLPTRTISPRQPIASLLTQWNLVLAAARRSAPEAEQALAKLYDTYWKPIYAYVRRRGYSAPEAEDLTQSYFVRLLEKNFLRDAKSERGKIETFLLASLKNFLANEWDRAHAQKRGGQHQIVSLDEITSSGNTCPSTCIRRLRKNNLNVNGR
jgi:DNA-directed RNA polymerase specialized sigma24 family protein